MQRICTYTVLVVIITTCAAKLSQIDPEKLLIFVEAQYRATTRQIEQENKLGIGYPTNSHKLSNGTEQWLLTSPSGWTSGFYPGILWYLYNKTTDTSWQLLAEKTTAGLKSQQFNNMTHDVGFIMFYSFGYGYLINQDPEYKKILMTAAKSLSERYSPIVGCIRSWNGLHFQVIIDNMMNLELLWWAAANGADKTYFDMAVSHSDHMIRDCIKPNGTSYHLIDYNPDTGAVLSKSNTPQGKPGGVWSRGQAWAIYGFTKAYKYSTYKRYLDTAQLVADYFLANLPSDYIPYWDFDASPGTSTSRDTSAAAIVATALLELANYVNGPKQGLYIAAAKNIMTSLSAAPYLGDPASTDAVLYGGCIADGQPMVSLTYGDFYYVEALLRLSSKKMYVN